MTTDSRPSTDMFARTRVVGSLKWMLRIFAGLCAVLIVYALVSGLLAFVRDWQVGGALSARVAAAGVQPAVYFPMEFMLSGLIILSYFGSGILLATRRSDDWLAIGASLFLMTYGYYTTRLYGLQAVPIGVDIFLDILIFVGWLVFTGFFPNGRIEPRWARIVFPAILLYVVVVDFLFPQYLQTFNLIFMLVHDALAQCITAVAQVVRYLRVSNEVERQQSKWVVYGFVIGVIGHALTALIGYRLGLLPYLIVRPLAALLVVFAVAALMAAVMRYRLWDLDFLINRSLVYGGLTVLLGVIFAGVFFALRALIQAALGSDQDLLAVGLASAVVAGVFSPARTRLRHFVDQRIYGIEIDYHRLISGSREASTPREFPSGHTQTTFGSYTGLKLLGRGGMGEIYLGQHPTLHRQVAIKILPAHLHPNEESKIRFIHEAQVMARMRHPNIVSIHDYGEQDGTPYMVMEFLEGQDMSVWLRTLSRFPLDEALPFVQDIASALDYAHENGVIHRDIKPSNVMIQPITSTGAARTDRAILMDFGIAKISAMTQITRPDKMVGTLDYVAPEQIQGAATVDQRADIYSLGVMTYQMLAGELPFKHTNAGALLMAHLGQPPPDIRQVRESMPKHVAQALIRAMAKKPDDRFESAGAFAAAMM